MSWVKRRGVSAPSATPQVPMYNPNQHSTQELDQWANPSSQSHDNWYTQQQQYQQIQNNDQNTLQQGFWQQSYDSQNFNQQYDANHYQNNYNPGNFPNNLTYNQEALGNNPYHQEYHQNNLYSNAQNISNQENEGEAWNQAWGDEDNFNINTQSQQRDASQTAHSRNTEDSFGNDESWNWGVEDTLSSSQNLPQKEVSNLKEMFPKMEDFTKQSIKQPSNYDLTKPSSHQLTKRGKLDTPQWSTESQISQESSDDILQTSESDKSHKMSRNSTKSQSPLSGQDLAISSFPEINPGTEYTENAMNFENKEIVSNINEEQLLKSTSAVVTPKSSHTPPTLPPPSTGSNDDSKNVYKLTSGISHKSVNKFRSSNTTPPIERFQVPFHNQQVNLETLPDNSEQPDHVPNQHFSKAKSSITHSDNSEVLINDRNQYLETGELSESIPEDSNDQSESVIRSDISDNLPPPGLRRMIPGQMEQSEIRGNTTFSQEQDEQMSLDTSDTLPPPGLRRMVPGQMEQTESFRNNNFTNEPPTGLSRMVLGQTERISNISMSVSLSADNLRSQYNPMCPPEGLHRMIPGESSSPEANTRNLSRRNENDSDPEIQQLTQHTPQTRSATIGADTPPAEDNVSVNQMTASGNRLDVIGGSNEISKEPGRSKGSGNLADNGRIDKNRKMGRAMTKETIDSRDSDERDNKITNITNTIRNLTVGENLTDGKTFNTSFTDSNIRRISRQESSDSEKEQQKQSRLLRDKRSNDKLRKDKDREKERVRDKDRYSPDNYRDRKFDRKKYKDQYYDDESDFFSDKEKDRSMRVDLDRDYESKYSSLRKEKDKDRHRKDPRDYRRDDYYYGRRYPDDYDDDRSRPSSRSDSMRDLYRERRDKDRRDRREKERDREKERYRRRRDPREVYNPYQGYAYDPYNPYYQQFQYYENLRRTNPQAYAEWYHKYYQQMTGQASSYGGEDRASVHSGRSSANDEFTKDRYTRQSFYSHATPTAYYGDSHAHSVTSQYGLELSSFSQSLDQSDSGAKLSETVTNVQRLTPAKFATAHLKGSISSGRLLKVLPHYSLDGQNATVEICSLQSLLINNEDYKELNLFPGPLIKGVTHKKTIIEYCENKIKYAIYNKDFIDAESYILMWELLILLIRQNGMVVGTDIAELLLKNKGDHISHRPPSVISSVSSAADADPKSESCNQPAGEGVHLLKEEDITEKFREFLLYGSAQEALEWAMKHCLWGHALFLASKLDKRTYANVMMRFANGLTLNDPLQTLYQLLSGKMPAAITCISDEKWGDWRPHLAMILSNSKQRPELICKAITAMGDTLRSRGSLYAAQFCYLMAEVGFGKHNDSDTRLVLLGADHREGFPKFVINEAIHMTEIYEYACGLNSPDFVLPHFQTYKYLLATRLADYGLLEKSLAYLESISLSIIASPGLASLSIINEVFNLADKLKFYDPVGEIEDESEFGGMLETSRLDHSWLKNLRAIQEDYQTGLISHQSISNLQNYDPQNLDPPTLHNQYVSSAQNNWVQQYNQPDSQVWQPENVSENNYQQEENQLKFQQNDFSQPHYQEDQQQNYWSSQQQYAEQPNPYDSENSNNPQNIYEQNAKVEEQLQPQVTLPNQAPTSGSYTEEIKKGDTVENKSSPVKSKAAVNQEKTQSTGWFGGIFSKLSLKPKNQMKLPDDNNPKIVYDQEKKRWVNLDEDSNDPANELKPPPKMADIMLKKEPMFITDQNLLASNQQMNLQNSGILSQPASLASQPTSLSTEEMNPLKLSQSNMFKLQRSRNLKNSYVDVFNPGSKPTGPTMPIPDLVNSTPDPQRNFFIPQPVSDPNAPVDFLTPGGVPHMPEQQAQ